MSANENKPGGEVILYQTEDLQTRVQVRLDGQTAWLSLNELAELFQRDKSVISNTSKTYLRKANCRRRQLLQILQQFKRRAGARLRGTSNFTIWMPSLPLATA